MLGPISQNVTDNRGFKVQCFQLLWKMMCGYIQLSPDPGESLQELTFETQGRVGGNHCKFLCLQDGLTGNVPFDPVIFQSLFCEKIIFGLEKEIKWKTRQVNFESFPPNVLLYSVITQSTVWSCNCRSSCESPFILVKQKARVSCGIKPELHPQHLEEFSSRYCHGAFSNTHGEGVFSLRSSWPFIMGISQDFSLTKLPETNTLSPGFRKSGINKLGTMSSCLEDVSIIPTCSWVCQSHWQIRVKTSFLLF